MKDFCLTVLIGYAINKTLYKKYKKFFDQNVPFKFDFNLFEYSVSFTGDKMTDYKKDYYEDLPPKFK